MLEKTQDYDAAPAARRSFLLPCHESLLSYFRLRSNKLGRLAAVAISLICFCSNPVLATDKAYKNQIVVFELGGATNSPGVAAKGELIIEEAAFHYDSKFQGKQSYNYNLGETKWRYGLINNKLEARVILQGLAINNQKAGFSNSSLGSKIRICNESKLLPVTDLILDLEIPIGRDGLRNPGFDHSYTLSLSKQWTKRWGSVANIALDFSSYRTSPASDINSAISLPYAININCYPRPELNIFSHIFGSLYFTDAFANPLSTDFGASYALSKDLAFIAWLSKGLNEAAPALSVDFGMVFRL
jgi:hypothetical protein